MSTSRYIQIQTFSIESFDLTCPAEIAKGALLLDTQTKSVLLQLRINLLAPVKDISSITLKIEPFDDAGEPFPDIPPFTHPILDVYLFTKNSFGDDTPIVLDPRIRKVYVSITKVVMRNGDVVYSSTQLITPEQQVPLSSLRHDLQEQLKTDIPSTTLVDLDKLKYFPKQLDEYWLCACGRPNRNESYKCCRCMNSKDSIFENINEQKIRKNLEEFQERVRQKAQQARLQQEELARKKEEEALQKLEKARVQKKRFRLVSLIILCVVALTVIALWISMPALKYARAMRFLEEKNYIYAIYMFDSLGDYKNSKEMVEESNYQKAKSILEQGNFDWAIKVFSYNPDYKDSQELINQANYQKAQHYFSKGNYFAALPLFTLLGDYEDSQIMVNEIQYLEAQSFLADGQYDSAITILETIPGYKDTDELTKEANYQKGLVFFENKQYLEAQPIFIDLGDYKESEYYVEQVDEELGTKETTSDNGDEPASNYVAGSTMVRQKDGMVMVYVPEGNFLMGSNDNVTEKPLRTVFTGSYWIDKFEVTNGQFAKCVESGVCTAPYVSHSYTKHDYFGGEQNNNYPVFDIYWSQAQEYCQWVGGNLPTEAQWEKAARGIDGQIYPWGNEFTGEQRANYGGGIGNWERPLGDTSIVGAFPLGASPYGAQDMAGNVMEWVADCESPYYFNNVPYCNPLGAAEPKEGIARGGNWLQGNYFVRASIRHFFSKESERGNLFIGFRCAYPVNP